MASHHRDLGSVPSHCGICTVIGSSLSNLIFHCVTIPPMLHFHLYIIWLDSWPIRGNSSKT